MYDNYGVNEIGHGALECQHHGLHFMEDLTYFEILDTETSEPVEQGRPRRSWKRTHFCS